MPSMIKLIFVMLTVLNPDLRLDWLSAGDTSRFTASLEGYESELRSCVASGLSLRFRYEFQVCKDRKLWFDDCGSTKVAFSTFEFDPISETYVVNKDFLGDLDSPRTERFEKMDKALARVSTLENIMFDWVREGADRSAQEARTGLRGRVLVECRGDYSASVKRLSYILSLGLLRGVEFDSGWVRFSQ